MKTIPLFLSASLSMSEKLAISGEMILRGMGTVFLVLFILWGVIAIFGKLASGGRPKEKSPKTSPKVDEKKPAPAADVKKETPAPVQTVRNDDSIIAAIIAAVEAYRAEEGLSGLPYRVVSFKRKSGRKSWNGSIED